MSKMCPMDGCRASKGFCIHERIMMGMVMALAGLGVAQFCLGLFG